MFVIVGFSSVVILLALIYDERIMFMLLNLEEESYVWKAIASGPTVAHIIEETSALPYKMVIKTHCGLSFIRHNNEVGLQPVEEGGIEEVNKSDLEICLGCRLKIRSL